MKTFNKNSILLFLFLIFAVAVGVHLVLQNTNFFSKAKFLASLKDVVAANITDSSFSVTWVTDTPTRGYVVYGTNEDKLTNTAIDDRDTDGPVKRFTHHATLTNLTPSTNYYFKIGSDDRLYDNKGKLYTQVTAPISEETPTLSDPLTGKVKTLVGKVVEDALIYLIIGKSSILSTYPNKEGHFLITLNNTRTIDLSEYKKFEDLDKIFIAVQGGMEGQAVKELSVKDAKGTQEIVLNKGWSIFSNTTTTPAAPSNLQGSCANNQLKLSWSSVPGADRYTLRINDLDDVNKLDLQDDNVTGTSYTFPGIPGHNYDWWIHSFSNKSGGSDAVHGDIINCPAAIAPTPPAVPSNLQGSCINNQLKLSWSTVSGADRYTLRINDLDDVNKLDLQDDNVINTSYTFSAIPGHNYDWWIHSFNNTTGGSDAIHGNLVTCQ